MVSVAFLEFLISKGYWTGWDIGSTGSSGTMDWMFWIWFDYFVGEALSEKKISISSGPWTQVYSFSSEATSIPWDIVSSFFGVIWLSYNITFSYDIGDRFNFELFPKKVLWALGLLKSNILGGVYATRLGELGSYWGLTVSKWKYSMSMYFSNGCEVIIVLYYYIYSRLMPELL